MVAAQQLQIGFKHDASGTPVGPYGHGQGGLFSQPGQDMRVFGAMLQPLPGLLNELPVLYTDPIDGGFGGYLNEFFTTITGVTAANDATANQPTTECGPFPAAGLMKVCTLVSPLGRYGGHVDELNLEKVGLLLNPADPTNLQLVNRFSTGVGPALPGGYGDILTNEFTRRAFTSVHAFQLRMSRLIWSSNPVNTAASNGYKETMGLDLQINSGNKRDAYTSNLCTAMDSQIYNNDYALITGTTDIVSRLDSMYFQLNWIARQSGLDPVEWAIVMRPELFDELSKVWPIKYYQELVASVATTNQNVARFEFGSETAVLRDEMRRVGSEFLPIRGRRVRVILDTGITEQNVTTTGRLVAGQYASDIYFVPLTVVGGVPVLYIEPFRMDNPLTEAVVREGRVLNTWTSDGGMFRWYVLQTRNCISWDYVTMFRLVLRTPQLAGRITNVSYQPYTHLNSAYPDSNYFVNGGRTNSPVASYYAQWSGATPTVVN